MPCYFSAQDANEIKRASLEKPSLITIHPSIRSVHSSLHFIHPSVSFHLHDLSLQSICHMYSWQNNVHNKFAWVPPSLIFSIGFHSFQHSGCLSFGWKWVETGWTFWYIILYFIFFCFHLNHPFYQLERINSTLQQ